MVLGHWMFALPASLFFVFMSKVFTSRMTKLKTKIQTTYAANVKRANAIAAIATPIYFVFIILVDTGVLSSHPWYTIGSITWGAELTHLFMSL